MHKVYFSILRLAIVFSFSVFVGKNAVYADWNIDNHGELIYTSPTGEVLGTVNAKKEGEISITRLENDKSRTDIYLDGTKLRFEQLDGKMIIKAEKKDGSEVILGEQELFKIEEKLGKNIIKIATGSGNSFVFASGTVGAKSNFPLSVDLATNALTVSTSDGSKVVTVLPDAAVQNMLAANVINRLGIQSVVDASSAATLRGIGDIVTLGLKNGAPVYEIPGISDQKLLGFIPVSIPLKAVVSAETGALVVRETSPLNTLLDLVSF